MNKTGRMKRVGRAGSQELSQTVRIRAEKISPKKYLLHPMREKKSLSQTLLSSQDQKRLRLWSCRLNQACGI